MTPTNPAPATPALACWRASTSTPPGIWLTSATTVPRLSAKPMSVCGHLCAVR